MLIWLVGLVASLVKIAKIAFQMAIIALVFVGIPTSFIPGPAAALSHSFSG
jgi:hypothetical protein